MRYCPSLKNALPNGFVKIRSNGRIARFSCNEGFSLYGNQYSTCIRNNWNRDLPVCVCELHNRFMEFFTLFFDNPFCQLKIVKATSPMKPPWLLRNYFKATYLIFHAN